MCTLTSSYSRLSSLKTELRRQVQVSELAVREAREARARLVNSDATAVQLLGGKAAHVSERGASFTAGGGASFAAG